MPDIQWHVGEDQDQEHETIRASDPRRSRRSWIAILIVVILGVGLGMMYRSIPEPAPRPTPTPIPVTATPQPLPPLPSGAANTIEQEAQALAHGNFKTFIATQDADDAEWQQLMSSTNTFNAWGVPPSSAVYTIVDSGTLPNDYAWADVIQYRDGRRFRETRFYRLRGNQWVRTRPVTDQSFWGEWQTIQLGHFNLKFRDKDRALAVKLADQLDAAYQRICTDLHCPESPTSGAAEKINYQITLSEEISGTDQTADLELSSPRIAGFYLPESGDDLAPQADSFNQTIYRFLVTDLMERLAKDWRLSASGTQYARYYWILAISYWELARLDIQSESALPWVYLHTTDLPSLESLWKPSETDDELLLLPEASAFVKFVAETYGPEQVLHLLRQVNTAPSVEIAVKQMGLSYPELQQKWEIWLKQLVDSQS